MENCPKPEDRFYTVEEYLAFDEASECKNEYFHGVIVPMGDGYVPEPFLTSTKGTVEDYFRLDSNSDIRHEYFSGDIVAKEDNSPVCLTVIGNLVKHFTECFADGPLRSWFQSLRVKASSEHYFYPDLCVTGAGTEYLPTRPPTTTNPIVIVEVAPGGLDDIVRGWKLKHYRSLLSVQHCVLVSPNSPWVELWTRKGIGRWDIVDLKGLDATVDLLAIDLKIPVAKVYEGIEFPVKSKP